MQPREMNGEWRDLWAEYAPRLLLFARQQTPRLSDAEDIVQDAFVRYWRAQQANPSLSPDVLFVMIRRIAIDYARKNHGRFVRESEAGALSGPAEVWFVDPAEEQERKEEIEKALRSLPAEQREVLVLKVWGELTFERIGEMLEISPHTAASRYRYGLNQLKRVLSGKQSTALDGHSSLAPCISPASTGASQTPACAASEGQSTSTQHRYDCHERSAR
ncbi:MAG: ECF RNA polymerase sigma factor SigE [Verrucomicrobia bacterium ADurb.Bin006]|jgi:RNA polymerase sigma-70 factor (ECF subfamily)|nr:MAG: ECF RNA polymerase sigma factor SigE [Verrucomicrobia bacterium ADurb.Bin006]HOU89005.1 sigma-70 family RNA polymerase sigma factor [Verrucomicrobiota bacterium]